MFPLKKEESPVSNARKVSQKSNYTDEDKNPCIRVSTAKPTTSKEILKDKSRIPPHIERVYCSLDRESGYVLLDNFF